MVLAISVTIGEEEVSLDINEAKELYEDLKRLFNPQIGNVGQLYSGRCERITSIPSSVGEF